MTAHIAIIALLALAAWFSPEIIEWFERRPRREEDEIIRKWRGI